MTVPLILLAIPSVLLGLALGPAARRQHAPPLARAGLPRAPRSCSRCPHEPYALFGIDGGLILASVTVAAIGVVAGVALLRRRTSGRSGCRPGRRPSARSAPGPGLAFLYRGVAQQVVVRRAQPPAVHRHRRADRRSAMWWFDREVVDGTVNGVGRLTVGAGRGLRRVQTGPGPELRAGHRHRAASSWPARTCSSRGARDERRPRPDPVDHHVPAAGRRDRRRGPAEPLDAAGRARLRARDLGRLAAAARRLPAGATAPGSSIVETSTGSRSSASSTSSASTGCRRRWSC